MQEVYDFMHVCLDLIEGSTTKSHWSKLLNVLFLFSLLYDIMGYFSVADFLEWIESFIVLEIITISTKCTKSIGCNYYWQKDTFTDLIQKRIEYNNYDCLTTYQIELSIGMCNLIEIAA